MKDDVGHDQGGLFVGVVEVLPSLSLRGLITVH